MKSIQKTFRIIVPVLLFLIIQLTINNRIKAQANIQDSLALLEMFETMNGPNWNNHNGWGTGPLFSWPGWYGVSVYQGRVRQLNLNFNNLTGNIPPSFCNLSELSYAALGGNSITSIPEDIGQLQTLYFLSLGFNLLTDVPLSIGNFGIVMNAISLNNNMLSGIIPDTLLRLNPGVSSLDLNNNQFDSLPPPVPGITPIGHLRIYGNRLHFDDIEAWMSYPFYPASDFEYSPQDSVCEAIDTIIMPGSSITFSSKVGGSANTYKWYRNGTLLSVGPDPMLTLNNVNASHSGNYCCVITNSLVPGLTLYRRHIFLTVDPAAGSPEIGDPAGGEAVLSWNSTSRTLIIQFSKAQAEQNLLQIFDLQGRLLRTIMPECHVVQNTTTIDCSGFPTGIYLVRLVTSAESWSGKICIF